MPIDIWTEQGVVAFTPCWSSAGPPTSGSSGSFAGIAQRGDLLADRSTGLLYQNIGTGPSPTWQVVGSGGSTGSGAYNQPLTGATITAPAGAASLILEPAAEIAALAVHLPPGPLDRQGFRLSTTKAIDALTVTSTDGSTVNNGSLVMGANSETSWIYRLTNTTWYP